MGSRGKTAVARGRVRDALAAAPILLAVAGLVQAAPPTGTLAPMLPRQCPTEMILVGDVCVDRWEGSLLELREASEIPWSPYYSPHAHKVRAVSKPGVVPQAYISMADAKRACEASKKRLCRATEWRAACRGPQKTVYPYGDAYVAGTCTDSGRTAPLPKLYSGKAMFENKSMIDARLNQLPNTVARTGEAAKCTPPAGASATSGPFDMVGNVHEWTDDGTLHGGFYLDARTLHEGCDYVTTAHAPVYYDYSTGFRCCADPTFDAPPPEAKSAPPVASAKKLAKL